MLHNKHAKSQTVIVSTIGLFYTLSDTQPVRAKKNFKTLNFGMSYDVKYFVDKKTGYTESIFNLKLLTL